MPEPERQQEHPCCGNRCEERDKGWRTQGVRLAQNIDSRVVTEQDGRNDISEEHANGAGEDVHGVGHDFIPAIREDIEDLQPLHGPKGGCGPNDEEAAKEEEIELVIQINGKLRGKIMIPAGLDDDTVKEKAFADPKVQELIKDKPLKKIVVVKGKLVNIVV